MWPPSVIERNDHCGQASSRISTISRIGRRVEGSLTTSVGQVRAWNCSTVVCSSMAASHSWKFGGRYSTKAARRFSGIASHAPSPIQ